MRPIWIAQTGQTPIGPLWVAVSEQGLAWVAFQDGRAEMLHHLERRGFEPVGEDSERTGAAVRQVEEYLAGKRRDFDLPIDWSVMTPFQEQVLRATLDVPYGQLTTYADLARRLGKPRAARAVGRAEATNPMPLVIPCHRVLGTDGKLHGYGGPGGIATKEWLLRLEGSVL